MRMLKLCSDEVLTEGERAFRDKYLQLSNISRNQKAYITVPMGPLLDPEAYLAEYTYKLPCTKCFMNRCFTIWPEKGTVCGICIFGDVKGEKCPDKYQDKGCWVQCHTCAVNYSITNLDKWNVKAKCHACRFMHKPGPQVTCSNCCQAFVSYGQRAQEAQRAMTNSAAQDPFVCPRCHIRKNRIDEQDLLIQTLMMENPVLQQRIPWTPYETIVSNRGKIWRKLEEVKPVESKGEDSLENLYYQKRGVPFPDQVGTQTVQTLVHGSGLETCMMCVNDTPVNQMTSACGHCSNRICRNCVTEWYGQVQVGQIVSRSTTQCPFCKSDPTFATIKSLVLGHLRNVRPTKGNQGIIHTWNRKFLHAVCKDCLQVAPCVERVCAREETPDYQHKFQCEPCLIKKRIADAPQIKTVDCPKCHVKIQKSGGCNHLSCPCGNHICYTCGADQWKDGRPFTSQSIYDHLAEECGGIFA